MCVCVCGSRIQNETVWGSWRAWNREKKWKNTRNEWVYALLNGINNIPYAMCTLYGSSVLDGMEMLGVHKCNASAIVREL